MLAVVGDIRLRAGDKAGGYKAFEQVLEINPDHVDARRRLRLRDMRTAKEDAAKPRGMSLKSLFSRKQ